MSESCRLPLWHQAHARYKRSSSGGGAWDYNKKVPSQWAIGYKELTFGIKPMGFKHTGIFPEQAVNWDWFGERIRERLEKQSKRNFL